MKTTVVIIEGTHCNACKLLIEDVCKDIKGVSSCSVDFETGRTVIEHDEQFAPATFKKEIESLGQFKLKS